MAQTGGSTGGINLQQVLTILQIGVAIITLAAISFYLGKHSRILEENTGDIKDLKGAREAHDRHFARHDTQLAILARETGSDIHNLNGGGS